MDKLCKFDSKGRSREDFCQLTSFKAQKTCDLYQYFIFLTNNYSEGEK